MIIGFITPKEIIELISPMDRVFLAIFLGALIGLERDIHGRAAGLRTHLLVCMGAALFMIISEYIGEYGRSQGKMFDPGRIAAQVVTGIGFIGAGTILKDGLSIRGLTTAACLWAVAGIGMVIGAGYYRIGLATTFATLGCLIGFERIEKYYKKFSYRILTVITTIKINPSIIIDAVKSDKELHVVFFNCEKNYSTGFTTVELTIRIYHRGVTDKMAHKIIKSLESINIPLISIKWVHQ